MIIIFDYDGSDVVVLAVIFESQSEYTHLSGRIPGCQSTNHTECYGELWTCENCEKTVCFAEGTDNHPELCDDCWVQRYAQENEDAHNEMRRS